MTVLDAYALVAFLRGETAAEEVAGLLRAGGTTVATANMVEVVDQLVRIWEWAADDVEADLFTLARSGMRAHPLDAELAVDAGRLRARRYHRSACPVSLADCVAAATALRLDQPLATADPPLAALVRAEGGQVVALPDTAGRRP